MPELGINFGLVKPGIAQALSVARLASGDLFVTEPTVDQGFLLFKVSVILVRLIPPLQIVCGGFAGFARADDDGIFPRHRRTAFSKSAIAVRICWVLSFRNGRLRTGQRAPTVACLWLFRLRIALEPVKEPFFRSVRIGWLFRASAFQISRRAFESILESSSDTARDFRRPENSGLFGSNNTRGSFPCRLYSSTRSRTIVMIVVHTWPSLSDRSSPSAGSTYRSSAFRLAGSRPVVCSTSRLPASEVPPILVASCFVSSHVIPAPRSALWAKRFSICVSDVIVPLRIPSRVFTKRRGSFLIGAELCSLFCASIILIQCSFDPSPTASGRFESSTCGMVRLFDE
jgi:hypothetical protein